MSYTRSTSAAAMGPTARRHLVHHVGEGHAAIHVGDHQRAARAAPGTHPAFREEGQHLRPGQAITDAELERYAQHEVDPVALHFEDPVDRPRREQPDAIDFAAAGHRRLEARHRAGIAVAVGRADVGAPPALGPAAFMQRLHGRAGEGLERHAVGVELGQVGRHAAGGGTTLATRWNSEGGRPMWKSAPSGPAICAAKNSPRRWPVMRRITSPIRWP